MTVEKGLPATFEAAALIMAPTGQVVLALVADATDAAGWRYIDFFTSNIRGSANGGLTRRARCRAM